MEPSVQHTGSSDKVNMCHYSYYELGLLSLTRKKQDPTKEKPVLWSLGYNGLGSLFSMKEELS